MYKYIKQNTTTCACMHSIRTCICIVHVYVVIHFCYSVRIFEWKWINAGFVMFVYIYIVVNVGHPIIRRGGDPINRFKLATFLCLSHVRAWIFHAIFSWSLCCGLLCVEWFEACSFCWYWWNCWQSMFKLSFHN